VAGREIGWNGRADAADGAAASATTSATAVLM
jgi:hypothetical protein